MTNLPQFPLPKVTLWPVGKFGKFCHIHKIYALFAICKRALLSCHFHWLVVCWRRWRICDICQMNNICKIYRVRRIRYIWHSQWGPSCLVISIELLAKLAKLSKSPAKQCKAFVGSFDNFANFVVACISGHKWIWVKRQAKHTKESFLKGAFALTMATVKTLSQNINLIGRFTKNNKSVARAARTLEHFFQCLCHV